MSRAVLLTVLCVLSASPATAAPLVFDFEDGLQGWELHGAAQRVQTQVLGGEWVIFGDGSVAAFPFAEFTRQVDLTGIGSVSMDVFFVEGVRTVGLWVPLAFPGGIVVIPALTFEPLDPTANPGTGTFDLRGIDFGVTTVRVHWGTGSGAPASFIDNITFHPIPEPGHLGLLGLIGLTALLWIRKGRKSGSSRDPGL